MGPVTDKVEFLSRKSVGPFDQAQPVWVMGPFGLTACGNQCVSTSNDPRNCGACGNSCGTGPVNGCSDGKISMREILDVIEERVGKRAVVESSGPESDATPFLDANSRYNDNSRARGLGFEFATIRDWFGPLVNELASRKRA